MFDRLDHSCCRYGGNAVLFDIMSLCCSALTSSPFLVMATSTDFLLAHRAVRRHIDKMYSAGTKSDSNAALWKSKIWFPVHGRHSVMAAMLNQEPDTSAFVVPLPCNDEFQMCDSPVIKTIVLHMHRKAKDALAKLEQSKQGLRGPSAGYSWASDRPVAPA